MTIDELWKETRKRVNAKHKPGEKFPDEIGDSYMCWVSWRSRGVPCRVTLTTAGGTVYDGSGAGYNLQGLPEAVKP